MSLEDPSAAKGVVTHVDETQFEHDISNYRDLIADAALADQVEHTISFRDSFRIHKKAIMWSMLLSSALIMEGYDVVVVSTLVLHYIRRWLFRAHRQLIRAFY